MAGLDLLASASIGDWGALGVFSSAARRSLPLSCAASMHDISGTSLLPRRFRRSGNCIATRVTELLRFSDRSSATIPVSLSYASERALTR
jgi:hypothetical protein